MLSHLASSSAPTGAERSLALLAGALGDRGHRVCLFAPGPWPRADELRARGVEIREQGCRPCWLTYHDPRSWLETSLRGLRCGWPDPQRGRLSRALTAQRFDVAHVNCLPYLGAARAARAAGLPVVWHLREILPAGARRRWWARRLDGLATRIVAVSGAVGRWVEEEGLAARLEIVHNGARPATTPTDRSAARAQLGLPDAGTVIGLFGQLLPHKGPLHFVRAASAVAAEFPDALFVLAGAAPAALLERVRQAASAVAGGSVRVLAAQRASEPLYAAADAVCLATTTPDPLPRSVLEAMAAGLPVVAFRSGGTEEMVNDGETGLLYDVGDVEGLADGFRQLLAEPRRRAAMGAAARRRVTERFSLERHVDRMEALLADAARS